MTTVKSFVVPIVAVVFGIGSVGTALAQATSTAPAQAPATTPVPATTPAPAQKPAETKQKPMEAKTKSANGMVKSASADSLVVAGKEKVQGSKDMKDAEWTFAVDSKTAIRKSGKAVTAADLRAGDQVQVRYMDHGGKMTAVAVQIKPTTAAAKPTEKK
ncbi:MAG: hypothetical protein DME03_08125 [Candidatus Rokuibacteriota bacterium]|nr:MAG: hypothetical protein DME03_08125 [Candidatus Rokubacteria bacterium]